MHLPGLISLTPTPSASGLGRACAVDIAKQGGNVAILDMNEDAGQALVKELGSSAKFWTTDVLETESVAAAINGAIEWIKHTGKPLGGIIPAAGVGHPGLVFEDPYPYAICSPDNHSRSSTGKASPSPSHTSTSCWVSTSVAPSTSCGKPCRTWPPPRSQNPMANAASW